MTSIKDLESKLAEYRNPTDADLLILKVLNKELYTKNKKKYNTLAQRSYIASLRNDRARRATIICNWLECSNFQEINALNYLNSQNTDICDIYGAYCNQDLKYKVLTHFCASSPYPPTHIADLLSYQVIRIAAKKSKASTTVYHFDIDDLHKLQLITHLIPTYKDCLIDRNLKVLVNMNIILSKLSMCNIPDTELLKVMALYQHLKKPILNKISRRYPEGKFELLLSTAQALGVVDNVDYWVQSLPSQQKTYIADDAILPILE